MPKLVIHQEKVEDPQVLVEYLSIRCDGRKMTENFHYQCRM